LLRKVLLLLALGLVVGLIVAAAWFVLIVGPAFFD